MLNTDKLKELKELLDMNVISQEEFDVQKKEIMGQATPKKYNIGLIFTIAVVFIICISIISSVNTKPKQTIELPQSHIESSIPEEFVQPCPIEVSSSMYDNIIGVPEIKCTFNNNTDKEIAAIKLYFTPRDVYNEEINTILTTKQLYTDNSIGAGETATKVWSLLDNNIKSGDIYVYSVYFADGTEWGNKEAPVSDIKKYAYKIATKY